MLTTNSIVATFPARASDHEERRVQEGAPTASCCTQATPCGHQHTWAAFMKACCTATAPCIWFSFRMICSSSPSPASTRHEAHTAGHGTVQHSPAHETSRVPVPAHRSTCVIPQASCCCVHHLGAPIPHSMDGMLYMASSTPTPDPPTTRGCRSVRYPVCPPQHHKMSCFVHPLPTPSRPPSHPSTMQYRSVHRT